ncbi:MAG: UDP-N-acetylmuramate dehydrogenase [Candidatus Parcubacteria bacterium]|nr:UDP-N-acetylmuramate dehydrogenase [Candidatus Parcubacteria bacterium]
MGINILKNISLAQFTTYHIGGTAEYFARPKTPGELLEILDWAEKNKQPIYILGGGSNILVSDKGYEGLIIKLDNQEINRKEWGDNKITLEVGSGVSLGTLVQFCSAPDNFLTGLEWAAGIPGCVGGAVFGNAGAFGESIGGKVKSVYVYDTTDRGFKTYNKDECQFAYRTSLFKEREKIIWSVLLELETSDSKIGQEKILECLKERQLKQPLEYPSAGCVFKNPSLKESGSLKNSEEIFSLFKENIPAGWLIDKCGLKGYQIGQAQISPKHANFFVNLGEAKAQDVFALIELTKTKVFEKFGCQLIPEINFLGNFS